LLPFKFSKTHLVVRYNITIQTFCSPRKYHLLVAALSESIDIRDSLRDDAQIMSHSTLSLLPDIVFMAHKPPVCFEMSSVTVYCAQRGRLHGNFRVAIISNA